MAYVRNAAVETYTVLGEITVQVVQERYDATTHYWQAKVQFTVGGAKSTVSDWLNVQEFTSQVVGHKVRYDTGTKKFQYAEVTAYLPENVAAGSWTDLADGEESLTTPCDQPGG